MKACYYLPEPWKEFLVSVNPYKALSVSGWLILALMKHVKLNPSIFFLQP
jgi:hypothetical protein